ncbi:MAG: type I restriction enzyme S subunit [Alteromonadaceae bacterium]|jgi:type I restriction enzyme S subunit
MAETKAMLPIGWDNASLIELAKFIDYRGRTPKKTEDGIPLITAKNIRQGYIDRNPREFIATDAYDDWMTRGIPKVGDVLLTTEAPLGNVAIIDIEERFALAQRAICFQFYESYVANFIFYFLRSPQFQQVLNGSSTGTTVKGIKAATLKKLEVNIPPLPEQKRIVEKLDSLLAQVESIQQRLNNLPNIIKRFRQSVLAAAVSGKLTEQWRVENDCEKFTNKRLGDVVTPISQGWSPKCNNVPASEGDWGVIKTSAVQSIHFVEQENKELPDHLEPREKLLVQKGDILVTRAGPRVRCGITCLVTDIKSKLMICDKVYRFQVKEEKGINKFLVLQLNSLKYLEEIEKLKTGISESGMNLTQKKFKELLLEWPSKNEQTEIVRLVEQYFALADTLEKNLTNAKKRVDNLTQSILAKAFRGELVPQDPNDEPADKLLERIKAARLEADKLEKAAKKVTKASKTNKTKNK